MMPFFGVGRGEFFLISLVWVVAPDGVKIRLPLSAKTGGRRLYVLSILVVHCCLY